MQDKQHFDIHLKDKREIYSSFMPFIKEGGIFIRSDQKFELGDEVSITLKIMQQAEIFNIAAKVVWLTPKLAQGNLPQGIGVQFLGADARRTRDQLENYLAGMNHQEMTDTM